jgi:hypothetical protein
MRTHITRSFCDEIIAERSYVAGCLRRCKTTARFVGWLVALGASRTSGKLGTGRSGAPRTPDELAREWGVRDPSHATTRRRATAVFGTRKDDVKDVMFNLAQEAEDRGDARLASRLDDAGMAVASGRANPDATAPTSSSAPNSLVTPASTPSGSTPCPPRTTSRTPSTGSPSTTNRSETNHTATWSYFAAGDTNPSLGPGRSQVPPRPSLKIPRSGAC